MRITSLLLYMALIFTLYTCGSARYTLNKESVTYEELFTQINQDQNKLHSFEGNARISVDSETFSGTFMADIYRNRHDSLLINVEGPFGLDVGKMFIGNNRFIFYNKVDNNFFSGSISEFNNRNFLQFPIKIYEISGVFTARDSLVSMKIEKFTIDKNLFYIQGTNTHVKYEIWIDPHTGHISRIEYIKNGETVLEKEYRDFTKQNDLYFPTKIIIKRPLKKQAMSIYYTHLKLNEKIDNKRFIIRISDNAQQFNVSLQ